MAMNKRKWEGECDRMFIGVPRDEPHTEGKGKGNKEEGTTIKKKYRKTTAADKGRKTVKACKCNHSC